MNEQKAKNKSELLGDKIVNLVKTFVNEEGDISYVEIIKALNEARIVLMAMPLAF